ncbi:MAG: nuclear transport factor 2 family protein [Gemmatimonadota bacterium]|nr:MAG: nuclear transport factor 2 family protein [Gemmatimonadota bacterium]
MRALTMMLALMLIGVSATARGQTAADSAAIRAAALDYIEGWYAGNAERMERALHPDLAKRMIYSDRESGASRLHDMTAKELVSGTRSGGGSQTPTEEQRAEVTILDIYGNAASVKVVAKDWVDYLHVGKFDDRWVIINVLWELTPEAKQRQG